MASYTATHLADSWQRWTAFLTTASRLYKYPFHEQLMIFAQRPDATACAEYDLWNDTMRRYVRRGSKGIALVDNSREKPRLRYVFDISDTGTREHSRTPWLWTMNEEHTAPVMAMLERNYDVSGGDLAQQLADVAAKLAEEEGLTYIHPFNDLEVATGQGTIAYEIFQDLPDVDIILVPIGGGGLAAGVSTLAKLLNPNVKVIGVEPEGAACMKASLEAGHVVSLPTANTIADGTAVKTPGDKVFPYIRDHVDQIITIPDTELVEAFLDVMEKHKMVVENSGLLSVAALRHLSCQGLNVVCVLSGGNMDVITMASLVQHGLIMRGRIFTFSVLLPDRPGALLSIADILARENGNVIKLEHNQFVNINRQSGVELKVTLEAFGHDHKDRILEALSQAGYQAHEVDTTDFYH